VHVVVLALSLVGISIGWLPGVGWLGFALAAAAVALGVRGISDRRTDPAGLGYDTAGNFIGGFGLPWILALQIKHAGSRLDALLIAWPLDRLLAISAAAVLVFWAAQLVGRFRLRALCVALALAAALVFTAAGASAWIAGDAAYLSGGAKGPSSGR
jgi:hypothetical protein